MASGSGFRLGEFTVLATSNVIAGPGGEVHVTPRAMEVLVLLAGRAGEVVGRDEFGELIWAPAVVNDDSLTRCISELRRALGDQAGEPRFIKTVPKRGYQLIAEAVPLEVSDRNGDPENAAVDARPARRPGLAAATLLALVLALGVALFWLAQHGQAPARQPSIAVLAFEDLSPAADQDYFAQGISEEILNALARIPDLKVAGRTSAFSFKGQHRDLREIARALGVAHVLEGSVRRQDNRVRITAQLVAADDGFHLWSETYDRELGDIFAVQEDISRAVAARLSELMEVPAPPLNFQRIDPAAYDLYLRARARLARRDAASLLRAADLFQAATLIEPGLDAAVSGRARALSLIWLYDPDQTSEEIITAARAAALRALELAPENAEALSTLSYISAAFDRDFERAVELTEKAIDLAPNQASIANFAGDIFRFVGDFERMLSWERRARELDPRNWIQAADLALAHYVIGDFESALEWTEQALALNAESIAALNIRAKSAKRLGRAALAREALAQLDSINPANAIYVRAELDATDYGPDHTTESFLRLIEMTEAGDYSKLVAVARIATLYEDDVRAAALIERATATRELFVNFPYRYLPEHWPADARVQDALDHPDLRPLWDIRRRMMPEGMEPIR